MTFSRRLFLCCTSSGLVCLSAQFGAAICYVTYQVGGKFLALPFAGLAFWPNFLVQALYPEQLRNWAERGGLLVSCFLSLLGWLVLGLVVATILHSAIPARASNTQS